MRIRCAALLFCLAAASAGRASEADPGTQADDRTVVLSDGVDMDRLFLDANGSDPATRSTAAKTLEEIGKRNPVGKRRLAFGPVSLELPSWQWDYNRKLGIHGIAVDRRPAAAADAMASVMVDRLPGMSDVIIGNVVGEVPQGARVSKTELKAFGTFTGTGVREVVMVDGATPQRTVCVLFYPKNKLGGYYIFTMFAGPPAGGKIEAELGDIAKSIRGR